MALPQHAYRDPARIAESDELHQLGCNGCARAQMILGKPLCLNDLKYPACRRDLKKGYRLARHAGGDA